MGVILDQNLYNFKSSTKRFEISAEMPLLPEGYPISAKVVADSITTWGKRITTMELIFPRYVLAEFNTHRALSRNASSSRAIPVKKALAASLDNIVYPVRWGKNQAGMQAAKENLEGEDLAEAIQIWEDLAKTTAAACIRLSELGLHKQWASRPAEWFSTIKVVTTFTEIENFFWLRDHVEAQDEICYLAQAMKVAMNESVPQVLREGEWHLPYVSIEEFNTLGLIDALKVSSSRCARTSYKTHMGVTSTLEDDIGLFRRLVHDMDFDENPFHASPTEHQATPQQDYHGSRLNGNFVGWEQHRKWIETDLVEHF